MQDNSDYKLLIVNQNTHRIPYIENIAQKNIQQQLQDKQLIPIFKMPKIVTNNRFSYKLCYRLFFKKYCNFEDK